MEAILSDIHGNLEALNAVLSDIRKRGIRRISCLGDFVGYGPNPVECINIASEFYLSILGNHDEAVLFMEKAEHFNDNARESVNWTRGELDRRVDAHKDDGPWSFLGGLQPVYREDGILYVHGSPRKPIREYVFPQSVLNPGKLDDIFLHVERVAFNGHTHIPGVIVQDGRKHLSPEEINSHYALNGSKVLVNVGSVGQPRDGNTKACYVLFDGKAVEFVRVEYDFNKTIEKIRKAGFSGVLADRLADGL